ncbi:MAG: amidohydrolase family protein [Candidatus Poseidoniaceae archaeon]|jgi:5-methylthioadenosine/S-adenosylhomocysteine deaminase|nr:amidohydrolase family protein [Candidatus Poseidoniaceae archaeon]
MADAAVLYTNAVLIDDYQQRHLGNFLLHSDGSWTKSNGDEDVVETIDGTRRLITRSFQNWHTHLPMQLNARDFSDGLPLDEWLEKSIFPTEMNLTPDITKVGTIAAALEMIKTGSTFACDMYHFPEAIANGLNEAGLRGFVCGPQTHWPPQDNDDGSVKRELDRLLSTNNPDNNVQYGVATHAVYTCGEDTLLSGKELAEKHDAMLHIHISETRKEVAECHDKTGMYPVEYLDSIDYFIPNKTNCAHGSWVKKSEMRTLAKHKAAVVHCPSSNMKLACGGTLSLPAYKEAGVNVRLGTDGPASNGSGLDMAHEARMACLVQRHDHWDAAALLAKDAFAMATNGSKDWAVWNLDDIRMTPYGRDNNRHISNLIYNGAGCLDLWVDGKPLMKDNEVITLDQTNVINNLNDAIEDYYSDIESY